METQETKINQINNYVTTNERLPRFNKPDTTPKTELTSDPYYSATNSIIEGALDNNSLTSEGAQLLKRGAHIISKQQ